MQEELQKIFQIPGSLKVRKMEEVGGKTIIHCTVRKQRIACKHCGGKTTGYDFKTNHKRHTVVGGKTVWLYITKRRVQCKSCRRVFVEPIEEVSRSHLTNHMIQQIQEKARGQDYTTVAREMGVGCATVCRKVWDLPVSKFKTPKKTN